MADQRHRVVVSGGEPTAAKLLAEIERTQDYVTDLRGEIQGAVTGGVAAGIHQALRDEAMVAKFWEAGYKQLAEHARDDVSKSVGRRVLAWAGGVMIGVGLYMAIKAGVLK